MKDSLLAHLQHINNLIGCRAVTERPGPFSETDHSGFVDDESFSNSRSSARTPAAEMNAAERKTTKTEILILNRSPPAAVNKWPMQCSSVSAELS
jgi:hypothetical protein